ncbi:MAG: AMP-binding protein, partial [Sulfitobacter sp.]|nr:AMP-binding protein [Sulfitobacter sp.]
MTKHHKPDRIIRKTARIRKAANMPDYAQSNASFSWADAQSSLAGLPDGHLNIAHEAIERHVASGHGGQIALRWIAKSGDRTDFTYADLSRLTNRFANVLTSRGLAKGDAVYALLGRVPDLYIAALGTLKAGCVFCPLFS